MEIQFKEIYQAVLEGDLETTKSLVESTLKTGSSADSILRGGMIPAMSEAGRLFEEGEYFVPELLIAARAMQGGLELLKPLLVAEDVKPVG